MPIEPIIPPGLPPPLAPYSSGTEAAGFIDASGTLAIGPKGGTVGTGDAAAQTRHVLKLIKPVLEAVDGSLRSVVFNQIFLKDLAHHAARNAVCSEYFSEAPPARYCIQVLPVGPQSLIEIATTACVDP
jgi:aminoacrylate peracid reductase